MGWAVWALVVVALTASGLTVAGTQQDAEAQVCDDIQLSAADGGRGLESAVQAANTCIGPQTIVLDAGVYQLTSWLVISDELAIVGDISAATRIMASPNLGPFNIQNVSGLVELRDLEVLSPANNGFLYSKNSTVDITNVDFSTAAGSNCGVTTGAGITADNVVLTTTDSSISGAPCSGISAYNNSDVSLTRVELTNNGRAGISIAGSLQVVDSDIHNNVRSGIDTSSAPQIIIETTRIYANGADGIVQRSGSLAISTSRIGIAPDGAAAGNTGAGIDAAFTDVRLDDVEVAHNALGMRLAPSASNVVAIAASSIHDNVGEGVHLNSGLLAISGTSITANSPDCTFYTGTWRDDGGNVDGDGTCGIGPVNQPPIAVLPDVTVNEGSGPAPLDAAGSSDPDGDEITVTWSDNVTVTTGLQAEFPDTQNEGTATVSIEVCDQNDCTPTSATATVNNVAPTVSVTAVNAPVAGSEARFTLVLSDAGVLDTHTATINWGHGTGVELGTVVNGSELSHTFPDPGTYTADLEVSDDAGAIGSHEFTIDVAGAGDTPPVAALTVTPEEGRAPLTVTANAGGSSDADGDSLEYLWDDAAVPVAQATRQYIFTEPGEQTITVRAVDSTGLISEPVSRVVTVDPPIAEPGSLDLTVVWQPIPGGGAPNLPLGAINFATESVTESTEIDMADVHTTAETSCDPTLSGTCSGTVAVPATTDQAGDYVVTTTGLPATWATVLAGDCAAPAGLNALDGSRVPGWFDVPPASSQQCTITLVELTTPTATHDAYVRITQVFEYSTPIPPLVDLDPTVTQAGIDLTLDPTCGGALPGGIGEPPAFQAGEACETLVPIRADAGFPDIAATLTPEGWTTSFAGDCEGTATDEATIVLPTIAAISECAITYVYVGTVVDDTALVDLSVNWVPLDPSATPTMPLGTVEFSLNELGPTVVEIAMTDIHSSAELACDPHFGSEGAGGVCSATLSIATTPSDSSGYLVSTSGLPTTWATILSDDCGAPAGVNVLDGTKLPGWFPVAPASSPICTITLLELELPTETHDAYLLVTHAFEYTSPVPPLGDLAPVATHAGTDLGFGEQCGMDTAGGEETTPFYLMGEDCETIVPIRRVNNQPDVTASVTAPGWTTTFAGDCTGTVPGEASLSEPTLAAVSRCDITHTYVGEVDPDTALIDLTVQWQPLGPTVNPDVSQPLGTVVFALEGIGAATIELPMQDVHDPDEQMCEPAVSGGNNPDLVCQAIVQLPVTPADSSGYLVSTTGVPATWVPILSGDCAVPPGQNRFSPGKFPGWFAVVPGSSQSCMVTMLELTMPAQTFDALVQVEHDFVYTFPVPPAGQIYPATSLAGAELDLGENCGRDQNKGVDGPLYLPDDCTVIVPYTPGPSGEDVTAFLDDDWTTTFSGDCVGTTNSQAMVVDPTTSAISVCSITHTYEPDVLPDLVARLVASPTIAPAPVAAVLNAGASTPAGNIISYRFDLTGEAFDSNGGSLGAVEPVTVTQPSPVLNLALPTTGAGVAWTVTVTVEDNLDRTHTSPSRLIIAGDVPPLVACTAAQQLPVDECQALVDLYLATDGDNWADNEGWLEPGTPCLWLGVSCFIGHVTKIELPANGLVGSLPESIEALTSLTVLDLTGNSLEGDVPDGIRLTAIEADEPEHLLRLRDQEGCLAAQGLTAAFLDELDAEWRNGCFAFVDFTVEIAGPFTNDQGLYVDLDFDAPLGVEVDAIDPLAVDPNWPEILESGCNALTDDRLGFRPTCSGRYSLRLTSPGTTSILLAVETGSDLGYPTLAGDCPAGEIEIAPGDELECAITIYSEFGGTDPGEEFAVVRLTKEWIAAANTETPDATVNYSSAADSGSYPVRAMDIGAPPAGVCVVLDNTCFEFLDRDCLISDLRCEVLLPVRVTGTDTIDFSEDVPDGWAVLFGGGCDGSGRIVGVVAYQLYDCTITNVHEPSGAGALVIIDWVIDKQVNALPPDFEIDVEVQVSSTADSVNLTLDQALPPSDQPDVACRFVALDVGRYPLTCTSLVFVDPAVYSVIESGNQSEGLWSWQVGDECADQLFALGQGGTLRCSVNVTPRLPDDHVDFVATLTKSAVPEGDGQNAGVFEIKVELDREPGNTVDIEWTAQPLPGPSFAPDQELEEFTGVLSLVKGQQVAVLTVPIAGDGFEEPDQEFFFQLVEQGFGSELRINATIVDDDAEPTVAGVTADEDEGSVPFEVEFRAVDPADDDGQVVGFRWSVYQDGIFVEDIETSVDRLEQTFAEPGEYRVALVVVDDEGNTSPGGEARPSFTVEAVELQLEVTPSVFTEGDPGVGPATDQPFEVTTDLPNGTELVVSLESVASPTAPEAPVIRSSCGGDADLATSEEFTISLSNSTPLPIRVCKDDVPEQAGILRLTFGDPASGVVVGAADVVLEDDDLLTVVFLQDEVFEGGFVPTGELASTGLRPAPVPHPFVYDLPLWQEQPVFTVSGASYVTGDPDLACLGSPVVDVVLPIGNPGVYYTCGDPLLEPDRLIELVAQVGAEQERFPIRIIDDDTAPKFSPNQQQVLEPPPTEHTVETITIGIPVPVDTPYQVLVTPMLKGGSLAVPAISACAGDFVPDIQLITIPANATSFEVGVKICGELFGLNPDGVFNLILSEPVLFPVPNPTEILNNSVLAVVPVEIVDFTSGTPTIEIGDAEVVEGDSGTKTVTLDVTMSGGPGPVTVAWETKQLAAPTSLRPATIADFVVNDGQVLFTSPGTKTISISIKGDTIDEGDEFFRVVLADGDGFDVADDTGLVKIIDNDAARVSVQNALAVDEGDTGEFTEMVFTITIDREPGFDVEVLWQTIGIGGVTPPSVTNPATGNGPTRDIESDLGRVTFAAGDTTPKQITVQVRGDDVDEANEHVFFFLLETVGQGAVEVDDGVASGLIIDDDAAPVISGAENQFVVLTSAGLKMPVHFNVTATDDRDGVVPVVCDPASGSLFAVGTVDVTCSATDSQGIEAVETFKVTVSESAQTKVRITDGSPADNVDPRDTVLVTADGFKRLSVVTFELRSDPIALGRFLADANGVVDATITIPAEATPGAHTIVARGVTPAGEPMQVVLPITIGRPAFVVPRLAAAPSFEGVDAATSVDDGFDIAPPAGAPEDATPLSFTG